MLGKATRFLLVSAALAAGCGGSSASRRELATADYRLTRDVMWTEILDVLRQDNRRRRITELSPSRLVTEWVRVHEPQVAPGLGVRSGSVVTRDVITLIGANPYRVEVDVQAAELRGDAPPWPLQVGASMPFWLQERRARLSGEIHDHLRAREHAR